MLNLRLLLLGLILVSCGCPGGGCKKQKACCKKKHGMINWSELSTKDLEGAKTFYGKVFGWQIKQDNSSGTPYHIAKLPGVKKEIAGMMQLEEEIAVPSNWGVYITVENVQETIELAVDNGAKKLVGPLSIKNVGTMAVIQDPQGAVFSIMQPDNQAKKGCKKGCEKSCCNK